jgi:hypothetical protein
MLNGLKGLKVLKGVDIESKIPHQEGFGLCPPNPPTGGEGWVGFFFFS